MPRKSVLYIGNKLQNHGKSPTGIDTLGLWLQEEGYVVISKSSYKNRILRLLNMISGVLKYRNKVNVVLIDTYSTNNFYYAVIIARLCCILKLSYIPILHGGNLSKRLQNSKILSQNIFKNAKTNVAPSGFMLETFEKFGFKNLTYIPNSIKIKNYPFLLRRDITCKLLWVRSFSEIYNPLLALEIVEQLLNLGIEVELCMVGPEKDGSLAKCQKIADELNLPIKFPGKLSKQEWIKLSQFYDVFINTTNFDNMPVSVMEAMALGMPVLSTNVGGIPYLFENEREVIMLPPNNAMAFVNAILELQINSQKVEELSFNARNKMLDFDWEMVKLKWNSILEPKNESTYI